MTGSDENLDEYFMGLALDQAREAEASGEVPVGCVIVAANKVIAVGHNSPIATHDPTAHAEINALRSGALTLGNYRLLQTTLYVTLEPCVMCAGAMLHARIERLVYGCTDLRAGAAGTVFDVAGTDKLNHRLTITGGVREAECRELLQAFFRARR